MRIFKKSRKSNKWARIGATTVEFVFVAPAIMVVMAVCVEFARLSMVRNLAQNAAYEAARFVMTDGSTVQDGIDRANTVLGRLGAKGATVTINGSNGVANEDGIVEGQIQFDTQTVTCDIELPLAQNSLIIPDYIVGDTKIRASMTVRTERYRGYYDGVSTN